MEPTPLPVSIEEIEAALADGSLDPDPPARAGKLPPTQERSRRRRDALLRAAIEVLAESGAKSVTHRAVAARAKLPAASTTYYFESIDQLTEEALRLHVSERVAELEALAATAAAGGKSAEAVARRFAEALADRSREAVIAQYEVYLEAARVPALREPVAQALDAFERLAEASLAALGAHHPEQAAAAFVAMIDGFALHRLARPDSDRDGAAALFEALRALFLSYTMDDDERERRLAKLREPLR